SNVNTSSRLPAIQQGFRVVTVHRYHGTKGAISKIQLQFKAARKRVVGLKAEIAVPQPLRGSVKHFVIRLISKKEHNGHFCTCMLGSHFHVNPRRFARLKSDTLPMLTAYAYLRDHDRLGLVLTTDDPAAVQVSLNHIVWRTAHHQSAVFQKQAPVAEFSNAPQIM